ncbi:MAG: hypothetical protein ACI9R3_005872 [Verrucomicrobiales bacterium]|jgi:uncharacterized protein (DUF1697 family)
MTKRDVPILQFTQMGVPTIYVALLRGINVGGKNRIPMKELAPLCAALGWKSVETYLQTGNVIFTSTRAASTLESDLERAIVSHFDFSIPIIVRNAIDFEKCIVESPLKNQAKTDPSRVLLYLAKRPIDNDAHRNLESRSTAGECVFVYHQSLWIHFPSGVGSSKLTSAVIDKAVGSTATGRNWNTASKIREMLSQ